MVLCSGKFDGLHAGHVAYLEAAKSFCEPGEELWVSVAPDSYIRETCGREPYWPQADRARTVAGLRVVHRVLAQADASIDRTIRRTVPRLLVKGIDWKDKLPAEVEAACLLMQTAIVFTATDGRHVSQAR